MEAKDVMNADIEKNPEIAKTEKKGTLLRLQRLPRMPGMPGMSWLPRLPRLSKMQ